MRAIRGRSVYILFYGATAAILPILTLYYESQGVSGTQLGILAALWPAGSMVGASLWGAVADGTGRHRLVLSFAILGTVVVSQTIRLGSSFLSLAPLVALFALAAAPIAPMIDHGVIRSLGNNHERYGRVRFWGAVGWGVSAPLVGIAIDRFSLGIAFPIHGVLLLGLFAMSFTLPISGEGRGVDVRSGLREIIRSRPWRQFLLVVFVTATGGAVVNHFLFIYLSGIGASATLRGISLTVATVSELAVFGLADSILRRFRAHTLLLVSMGAVALRLLLYGVISNPYLALAPQVLHGLTFSLRLVAGVEIARRLAPKGMGATAQALFTGTNMGAAGIAGALIGGFLYRFVAVSDVLLFAGIAELVFLGVFIVFGRRFRSND
jgi:PPP family 3-phenylpropionic acid transporter